MKSILLSILITLSVILVIMLSYILYYSPLDYNDEKQTSEDIDDSKSIGAFIKQYVIESVNGNYEHNINGASIWLEKSWRQQSNLWNRQIVTSDSINQLLMDFDENDLNGLYLFNDNVYSYLKEFNSDRIIDNGNRWGRFLKFDSNYILPDTLVVIVDNRNDSKQYKTKIVLVNNSK